MPRHRKVDRELTASRKFTDKRSFVDVYGMEFLSGKDMELRRMEVYQRDGQRCMLLASPLCRGWANWIDGEVDHIESRGAGGSDNLSNLRWTCKPCHRFRHVHPRFGESRKEAIKQFEAVNREEKHE